MKSKNKITDEEGMAITAEITNDVFTTKGIKICVEPTYGSLFIVDLCSEDAVEFFKMVKKLESDFMGDKK